MQNPDRDHGLSLVLISLMKGVTYRDNDPPLWQSLLSLQAKIREYVAVLGLELILDEAEGHAYLKQRPPREGEPELPRLVQRRQLSYHITRLTDKLAGHIGKLVEMGFLRRLQGSEERYEVGRILKSFVDAQWLQEFEARLAGYRSHGVEISGEEKELIP